MKNLKKIGCFLVILLFVLIISIFIRNPMKNLPEGDFVQSLTSPKNSNQLSSTSIEKTENSEISTENKNSEETTELK